MKSENVVSGRNAAKKIEDLQRDQVWLRKFASELRREEFYGKIELTYRKGRIVHVRKIRDIKPE